MARRLAPGAPGLVSDVEWDEHSHLDIPKIVVSPFVDITVSDIGQTLLCQTSQ